MAARPSEMEVIPSSTWTEDEWARKIGQDQSLQDTIVAMQNAVAMFEAKASRREVQDLADARSAFTQVHAQALEGLKQKGTAGEDEDEEEQMSFRRRFRRARYQISSAVTPFCAHVDLIAASCPNYVQAAWGSVQLLLIAETNHLTLRRSVEESLTSISQTFALIDTVTVYVPTAQMLRSLTAAYCAYGRFLEKAVKYYGENRFKTTVNAFIRPWDQRFQPAIDAIQSAVGDVLQTAQIFSVGALSKILRVAERMDRLIDGEFIRLTTAEEVKLLECDLRLKLHERTEQHVVPVNVSHIIQNGAQEVEERQDRPEHDEIDFGEIFPSLSRLEKSSKARRVALENSVGDKDSRQRASSLLNVDKVVSWLESISSEVLWVDGGGVLSQVEWNACLAVPLLRDIHNNFQNVTILRFLAGEHGASNNTNTGKTLVQSLIAQLFSAYRSKLRHISRDQLSQAAGEFETLWKVFLSCLEAIRMECIVIFVDSIDCLYDHGSTLESSDIQRLVIALDQLAASNKLVAKILLTSSLTSTLKERSSELTTELIHLPSYSHQSGPVHSLSHKHQQQFALKLHEISIGRCQSIDFASLPLLYPKDSVIYEKSRGMLRAYVVESVSGVNLLGLHQPKSLIMRCWYISHDGISLLRKYKDVTVRPYAGSRAPQDLDYVPSNYLANEAEERILLLNRGKRFFELSANVNLCQIVAQPKTDNTKPDRVIVDQHRAPLVRGEDGSEDHNDMNLHRIYVTEIPKPLTLLVCQPEIQAYSLDRNMWSSISIERLESTIFDQSARRLVLPLEAYRTCQAFVEHAKDLVRPQPDDTALVIVHGDAGMGKTSMIEAVVGEASSPLLRVDVDYLLSRDREDFRTQLRWLLESAAAWSCVLLFEGVDVFLSRYTDDFARLYIQRMLYEEPRGIGNLIFFTATQIHVLHRDFLNAVDMTVHLPSLAPKEVGLVMREALKRYRIFEGTRTPDLFRDMTIRRLREVDTDSSLTPSWIMQIVRVVKSRAQLEQKDDVWDDNTESREFQNLLLAHFQQKKSLNLALDGRTGALSSSSSKISIPGRKDESQPRTRGQGDWEWSRRAHEVTPEKQQQIYVSVCEQR